MLWDKQKEPKRYAFRLALSRPYLLGLLSSVSVCGFSGLLTDDVPTLASVDNNVLVTLQDRLDCGNRLCVNNDFQ